MISFLILTKDEEQNLPECLATIGFADDVVVLDSYSTDQTCELAKAHGARVFQREFDDFGSQRNYVLEQIEFSHPWIFHLDADERFTEPLLEECRRVIAEDQFSGFFVPNRIMFMGKWIKHCTRYPYPQVRLIKRGEIGFEKSGHGQRECNATRGVGHIHEPYDHYNFSKGLEDWFAKHNRYSTEEAVLSVSLEKRSLAEVFSSDPMVRKRALKSWFVRLPFRPQIKFLYLYLVCFGFLDGKPGLVYCRMQALYEAMIETKRMVAKAES